MSGTETAGFHSPLRQIVFGVINELEKQGAPLDLHWADLLKQAMAQDPAPDLYAALDALIAKRDRPHGFRDNPWYEAEFEEARQALAEARGEQP